VAGVDPVYGLYAGSITLLVGSLFASTSLLAITATNALAEEAVLIGERWAAAHGITPSG
jgi:MFS superfamily sulfate permease-like transporter